MIRKLKILFLCTGNSCRSQMAEGWARHLTSDQIDAWSAGIETHGMNPLAVRAMAEAGVDISGHFSKTVDELSDLSFDYVITVCDHAHESCPLFSGKAVVVHAGFDDPPRLAVDAKTDDEAMTHYRRVRDEIRDFVKQILRTLNNSIHKLGYQVFMEEPIKSPQRLPVRNIENQRRSDFFPARRCDNQAV